MDRSTARLTRRDATDSVARVTVTEATGGAVRTWKLEVVRKQQSTRTTAEHQRKALLALRDWYAQPHAPHGGLLCLPTGAGKTFTAIRFLCEGPLSDGKKVVWLAHTHHLLDQAIETFGPDPDVKGGTYEVGYVGGTRRTLTARVVSGAPGHHGPRHIEPTDDVIIATHQTLANAFRLGHARWLAFLQSARRTGLVVVFDEAHHAPANTYRALVEQIRGAVRECAVLGLTATPDYYDPRASSSFQA
jgi:superfamily II DNA or RNA helicase